MASRARLESNQLLRRWAAAVTGDVLSLGSGDDRDGEGRTYRTYFTNARTYTTSEYGPRTAGCDLSLDIRAMSEIADGRYDAIFCSGVLEHVDELQDALREIWRVLAPGGTLLLGVPFRQATHRAPQDFWRFTEFGVRHMLSAYADVEVVPVDIRGGPDFPSAYWAQARKPEGLPTSHTDIDKLESAFRSGFKSRAEILAEQGEYVPSLEPGICIQYDPPTLLSVVCWLWAPENGYRADYTPAAVNTLRRMVARHYPKPHRFLCVTDQTDGLDPEIEVIPPWNDYVGIPSPHGERFPGCYRRLRSFAPDIAETFGPRFVSLDLDCVITGDLRPLWDRPEDFVAWRDTHRAARYNGSMILMTAGGRTQVWDTFDPVTSPALTLMDGQCNGSDQGWISYVLGPNEATWTEADGVYSFKNQLQKKKLLPPDARIVFFHGTTKPWSDAARRLPWVRTHYR